MRLILALMLLQVTGTVYGPSASYARVDFKQLTFVVFDHNENEPVLVQCFSSTDFMIEPNQVEIVSPNRALVTFSQPQSGYCVAK